MFKRGGNFLWLTIILFLYSISLALLSYINSAFLTSVLPLGWLGIIYPLGYYSSIVAIGGVEYVVRAWGLRRTFLVLLAVYVSCLLSIGLWPNAVSVFISFVVYIVSVMLIRFIFDLLIEADTVESATGRMRAWMLTAQNIGWLVSPFLAGVLVDSFSYSFLYLLTSLISLPIVFVAATQLRKVDEIVFVRMKTIKETIRFLKNNHDVRNIFLSSVVLYIFYGVMVIYMPIHLLSLGYTWSQIGFMFTIMLIPFVLIQFPAGWLADHVLGEQEMLLAGFMICGLATMGLFFVESFWPVTVLLFCTRIGASLIEILTESYFFKQVQVKHIDWIGVFNRSKPLGYMIGPMVATVVLSVFAYEYLFLFLGFFVLLAQYFPWHIRDTR